MPNNPTEHPLGPPTVSGNTITVDTALNQPQRITRMIMDLTLQKFIADRIFSSTGGVTGGAVIYDKVQANELYSARDVQRVAPGTEFPLITSDRLVPSVAEVEKWGGKMYVTDEARDRNDTAQFTRAVRQLANTIVRKLNQRAIEELEAAIAAAGGSRVSAGHNWSTVVVGGAGQTPSSSWPHADFALADQLNETDELGFTNDLWIINPLQYTQLVVIYGADLNAVLASNNISVYSSNRVAANTAYAVASGQTGQMKMEKPLGTETWREEKTERNWMQSSVRPLMFVDNVFAVRKFTGLG